MPLKVGLCATESSGDILGSDLIRNLKSKDPLIEFFGLGGSEMRKEGLNCCGYINSLIQMGAGLPLRAIVSNTIGKEFDIEHDLFTRWGSK